MLAHTSRRSRALLAVASRAFATKPDALAPAPPVTPPTRGPPASSPASRTVTHTGQAFVGDLRSASALGLGDGITDHTSKWLQPDGSLAGNTRSPADWIAATLPIKVHGAVAASTGSDDPALGCPVEYIDLRGTSIDNPAVCKYTGLRYYSDDWMHAH